MRIFIDFDGTIVDVWKRYYTIFRDFFELSEAQCSLESYICAKREKEQDIELVKLFCVSKVSIYDEYKIFKRTSLEAPNYLRLDRLIPNVDWLNNLHKNHDIAILTLRRNQKAFEEELDNLDIGFLREKAVVISPEFNHTKYSWIKENIKEEAWIIGDSEADMEPGYLNNIHTCFVKSGLRQLNGIKSKPDIVINTLDEFCI